jgi:hypothetical protein
MRLAKYDELLCLCLCGWGGRVAIVLLLCLLLLLLLLLGIVFMCRLGMQGGGVLGIGSCEVRM